MYGSRHFHYYDIGGIGRDVTYCHDVPDLPHKSAVWSIERDCARDGLICVSYDTVVANIVYLSDGRAKLYVYGWYISATTRKHIRWFIDYLGIAMDVKDIKSINNKKCWLLYPCMYDKR